MADGRQHTAHAGREFRVFYVEFNIHRKLTVMAMLAQVVRSQVRNRPHRGHYRFRAQLHIAGAVATGTG
jgi:hypothetical protein